MLRGLLLLTLLLSLSVPVFAQGPRAEVSGGYSFVRDQEIEMNFQGWLASVTGNYNKWFGIEGEVGGNYNTTQVRGTNIDMSIHSFAGGPHFSSRMSNGLGVAPFGHVLVGAAHASASFFGLGGSTTHFLLEPGGGINYWFRNNLGIRLGGDYRRIFSDNGDTNQFRFHAGVVFGLGRF